MEQMALNMTTLFTNSFPQLRIATLSTEAEVGLQSHGFLDRLRAAGKILHLAYGSSAAGIARKHRSDTVRGWGAFAAALDNPMDCADLVSRLRPFADDAHFAVREWAWLSFRPTAVARPKEALSAILPLAGESSPRIRRFSCEATRPRGVWSAHIPLFKEEPWIATDLLDLLSTGAEKYVQDSVSNWMNDVARTNGTWVKETTDRWHLLHGESVARVCKRSNRNVPIES